jgi:general secretion pathway protein E
MNARSAAIVGELVQAARAECARSKGSVMGWMESKLGLARDEFVAEIAEHLDLAPIGFEVLRACEPAFDVVPYVEASKRTCVALRVEDGSLTIVLGEPFDARTHDWIENTVREPFEYRIAYPEDVRLYLAQREAALRAMDGVVSPERALDTAPIRSGEDLSIETISETDSPIIKLVSSTLYDALKIGASDIHFETGPKGLAIKYRIDGALEFIRAIAGVELADQVISRVKIVAELDIAERRIPQDGRFRAKHRDRDIDFRVSVMPNVHGEDAVVRILDKRALTDHLANLSLDQLGFDASIIARLRQVSTEPYGMLLVTGPTGSGKTTTLYAVISEINKGVDKIVTIEDPVEYQLHGVLQIPVNEKKGLTFAVGLRSILRHDPDRIMVGEIRDPETAEIAVQSALTGHLVYTTVHANNVYDVIGRFVHMGVDTFSFVSALNAVMAQRLVRVLCPSCSTEHAVSPSELERAGFGAADPGTFHLKRAVGCARCRGSGYRGRKAIAELMVLNDELRELIAARAPARQLRQAARAAGTRSLRESALDLVRAGETTLEEIDRVTSVAR